MGGMIQMGLKKKSMGVPWGEFGMVASDLRWYHSQEQGKE